jgi:hypothetical protein
MDSQTSDLDIKMSARGFFSLRVQARKKGGLWVYAVVTERPKLAASSMAS